VECSPLGGDKLVVRLHGRWTGRPRQAGRRVTLVVEDEGRRHRFPAIPPPRNAPPADQRCPERLPASQALAAERTQRAETESRTLSVAAQQASLEQKLTELNAVRAQAAQESKELGRELVGARENVGDHKAGLAQAEALLAEARALTASLREQ
jgi:hypothetical protein